MRDSLITLHHSSLKGNEGEKLFRQFLAEKGAIYNLVRGEERHCGSELRTSPEMPVLQPRHMLERDTVGGFHLSPAASEARLGIADISGSGSGIVRLPKEDNTAESSSPEASSPSDAAIDILSSGGTPIATNG